MSRPRESSRIQNDENGAHDGAPTGKYLLYLALGALGVVYGDIGTSPLYAFRESFHASYGIEVRAVNILGILSLIFWSLLLVISVKYLVFVMRADNNGEGGILALTALIGAKRRVMLPGTTRWVLVMMGLFGTALLYGDGMITPAISVLSAVEGLEVVTPFFEPYVIPITVIILVGLFSFQSRGTERVGKVFGPVTLVWFLVLAILGISWIVRQPSVLAAVNPYYAAEFFIENGVRGFLVLGSVFLVVTGGEALYADMGHFGRSPIRLAWFAIVLPALMLNYFGQGALLLQHPEAVENPFYQMAPGWALIPLVLIATAATVIASQALITGAFSLTMQAVQLGYLPRVPISHTSPDEFGQIYISSINWVLMVACVALVLAFRSSSNLAAAYGVAVTTTMVVTTLLLFRVERERWRWSLPAAVAFTAFFLAIDLSFWGANLVKIPAGGWFPLVIGAVVFIAMTTWRRGRSLLAQRLKAGTPRFVDFIDRLEHEKLARVPGAAIYMYSDPEGTPPALVQNLRHNRVLHEQVILLSLNMEDMPYVPRKQRMEVHALHHGIYQMVLHYGFMETPNVPRDLPLAKHHKLKLNLDDVSFFLGSERILATERKGMAMWREKLFVLMSRNATSAANFFGLPPDRVVEMGTRVEI
ncbi:MAG: potassium transporter Kup [Caldilinea sp.]|nr:potassium transporter Kup [Caldilinea sp.]MCB0149799.1 potassium transporter Kup [Caldilineaceae bacterium]MCB9114713.1 potassium transporter Kup [Caldilineaceae bacterium]MCB9122488.1 potassium transporter Kup [Caldilineaceae bacterium]MCO5213289.1 potassium transporter Kup [Caldilinea sp.]